MGVNMKKTILFIFLGLGIFKVQAMHNPRNLKLSKCEIGRKVIKNRLMYVAKDNQSALICTKTINPKTTNCLYVPPYDERGRGCWVETDYFGKLKKEYYKRKTLGIFLCRFR